MENLANYFFIVARESGAESSNIPAWANKNSNPIMLDENLDSNVKRVKLSNLPGSFQLLNVLAKEECERFKIQTEKLGYLEDAAVSLPRSVRHNNSLTWIIDEETHNIIWNRIEKYMHDDDSIFNGKKALGLNKRFRFYKYDKGDFFKIHTDGAWPGSLVINNKLINDAYPDRFSQMTFLILLNEDFKGGATQFYIDEQNPLKPARNISNSKIENIRTPIGGVLCFPHGMHPLHCLHSSEEILKGVKYIIRTDVLFEK